MVSAFPCELCGEPMPLGEEMFKYHGFSGPCPKPPLAKTEKLSVEALRELAIQVQAETSYVLDDGGKTPPNLVNNARMLAEAVLLDVLRVSPQ